jgi:hypothetical protein
LRFDAVFAITHAPAIAAQFRHDAAQMPKSELRGVAAPWARQEAARAAAARQAEAAPRLSRGPSVGM